MERSEHGGVKVPLKVGANRVSDTPLGYDYSSEESETVRLYQGERPQATKQSHFLTTAKNSDHLFPFLRI